MNERIRSLAEHAKTYANQCTKDIDGDVSWHWMDYYTEKFAELIVRECISIMGSEIVYNDNYKEKNNAISDMMELLKHFGIEE